MACSNSQFFFLLFCGQTAFVRMSMDDVSLSHSLETWALPSCSNSQGFIDGNLFHSLFISQNEPLHESSCVQRGSPPLVVTCSESAQVRKFS